VNGAGGFPGLVVIKTLGSVVVVRGRGGSGAIGNKLDKVPISTVTSPVCSFTVTGAGLVRGSAYSPSSSPNHSRVFSIVRVIPDYHHNFPFFTSV